MQTILGGIIVKQNFDAEAERLVLANMRRIISETDTVESSTGRLKLGATAQRDESHDLQIMRDYIEAHPSSSATDMLVLFEDQRVEKTLETQEGPKYKRLRLTEQHVANSGEAPAVKRSHVVEIAEKIVDDRLNSFQDQNPTPAPAMPSQETIANVFATEAVPFVEKAVEKVAPEYIVKMVDEMVPRMLADVVELATKEELETRLPEILGAEIDSRVATKLKSELQGTLGRNVTEKIRLLIHAEVMSMAQSGEI